MLSWFRIESIIALPIIMSKKITFFLIFLFLLVTALVSYRLIMNHKQNSKNITATAGRSSPTVYGIVAKGEEFSDFLLLTGSIEPNEIVEVRSEISGLIELLNFAEGSNITAGQVLLKINDSELRAQLSQAQTRSTLASENERRAKLLLEKEAISQEEYDIASADYRTSKAQIELIQAQLRKTVVIAPFSGKIGLRNVSKGSYITPSDIIAQLVNVSRVKLQFSVPEKYANMVKVGVQIKFKVQGLAEEFKASIYALEPLIDQASRTLTVRAITENKDNKLIPGAFANVILPLQDINNALLIPTEALIPIQNGKKVFLQKNGKAKEMLVETGARTDSTILIIKGIVLGDTVLTSGVMSLRDGSPVNVQLR